MAARLFSTTAQSLIRYIWKNTEPVPHFQQILEAVITEHPKLAGKVEVAEVQYGICS